MFGEIENEEEMFIPKKLGEKRDEYVSHVMSLVAPAVKSWYLKTSVKYLNEHQFKEEQEDLFADFTEFCTDELDKILKKRYSARYV